MTNIRLIARLDVKAPYLIKGVHMEGLRKLGDPQSFAERYYNAGIDEIIYFDAVASLYERNTIVDIVRQTASNVFIPITAGGGVRSVSDARELLRAGADKIAINTAAIKNPMLISEIASALGSQCMVLSVQAKRRDDGNWEAYCDQGREHTGRDVVEWVTEAQELGAGEVLLTSVDQEGTCKGFDIKLVKRVAAALHIPVIASGGAGSIQHLDDVVRQGNATAVAMANVLHYEKLALPVIRETMRASGLSLRPYHASE